jgi:ubiquinone/menaquinone biosynthesis C-methylase UbiE
MKAANMSVNEDFTTRRKIADIGRWFINEFVEHVSGELPVGCSILDAGAGEGAYKKYFRHCNYKAVDLGVGDERWNYGNLDYVAPLHDLPIEDYTFDAILCTQVLEHLEYPRESVEEFYRVLKVGGKLYLTAPMAHVEHQTPYDFFRYTSLV